MHQLCTSLELFESDNVELACHDYTLLWNFFITQGALISDRIVFHQFIAIQIVAMLDAIIKLNKFYT